MTNAQEKKGLSPLAWVGIGCGVMALIAIIVVVAGGLFVANKVKDVAGDFKDNPELAAARMVVRLNPEIEETDYDEEAGTITVRDKKTGKTMTASFEDIKEGKFSLTGEDGQTMTIETDKDGEGGSSMKVESEEGTWEMASGTKASDIPAWIPIPGDGAADGHTNMKSNEVDSGGLTVKSNQSVDDVMKFYQGSLESSGFQVSTSTSTGESGSQGFVNATDEVSGRSITVSITREEETTLCHVVYSDRM